MESIEKIIYNDVRCSVISCKKEIEKYGFGYLKDQTFFGEKPIILCPDCFVKKEENDKFVSYQYAHLPRNVWDPPWVKVIVDKAHVNN